MENSLDKRRIAIFLLFAFGIAWAVALVIWLTGGLINSPAVGNSQLTLATLLLATLYMWAPALANLLTRIITGEGFHNTWLRPYFRRGWPYWILAWFMPGIFTLIGMAVFLLLFPQYFDRDLNSLILALPPGVNLNLWVFFLLATVQAMIIAPLVNSIATFGEEFGWRGYLLQKLLPLGKKRALLWMGVIWGIWHWPIIAQGHNYGLDYAGFPWLGLLVMVWFTIVGGIFISWVTLRARSVWPAVIAHAAINGIAGLGLLLSRGTPNPLLGPSPAGLIGSIGFTAFALWIFFSDRALPENPSGQV